MPYDEKIETGLTTEHMALIYNIKAFCVCVCVCVCVCACVCVGVYVCVCVHNQSTTIILYRRHITNIIIYNYIK